MNTFSEQGPLNRSITSDSTSLEDVVLSSMSAKVTQGMDVEGRMRAQIFLMELMDIVKNNLDIDEDTLLSEMKKTEGYRSMDTEMVIPDETVLGFIEEMKKGLSSPDKAA